MVSKVEHVVVYSVQPKLFEQLLQRGMNTLSPDSELYKEFIWLTDLVDPARPVRIDINIIHTPH